MPRSSAPALTEARGLYPGHGIEMTASLLANPDLVGRIRDRVPLRKLGEPDDVVGPVVFLASDPSALITGHLLSIDGGVTAIVSLTTEPVVR